MKLAAVLVAGVLALSVLLIVGIGWAENLGDGAQAQVSVACAKHPLALICGERVYLQQNAGCDGLADDAANTAGNYSQAFTAQNWEEIYARCMGRLAP